MLADADAAAAADGGGRVGVDIRRMSLRQY